ncbi:MAG: murein biosynthesis integral membrane protein MurJ [Pseudomonadota bacterium]|nr:murein biosynthesis integral membrane protein MurJ [Pseudomonadota bacterium]
MSKGLLKSTMVVSTMTFISRILGFVRDMVFAYFMGAFGGFDAFVVAFKIPNFMRGLFAEGAFAQAFVPVLSEYRVKRSQEETKAFIDHTAGTLAVALLVVTLLTEIATPILVGVFAPGFWGHPEQYQLANVMLRITFPYLFLISLTAFSGAILNSFGAFASAAFNPVLLNVALISAAALAARYLDVPVIGLAWGVFAGGVLQLLFLMPILYRKGLLPIPRWGWHDAGVRRVMRLMVPALFGVSATQIGLLLDTVFASFLPEGSISWLYYSQQLTFFPLGVFGVALATVVLPHLSRKHADNHKGGFDAALDWALRCVLVIGIPAGIGLVLMAGPLIATLFYNGGAFTQHDVRMATLSLMAFSIGIPSFMLVKVLASGFYSRQDIRTPVRISVCALVSNVVMNCLFIVPLHHSGLALATALSSSFNAGMLFYLLIKKGVFVPLPGWKQYLARLGFANAALVLMVVVGVPHLSEWLAMTTTQRFLNLLLWVSVAIGFYLLCLGIAGLRLRDFRVQEDKLNMIETV